MKQYSAPGIRWINFKNYQVVIKNTRIIPLTPSESVGHVKGLYLFGWYVRVKRLNKNKEAIKCQK